jgi:hypothetical protein
MAVEVIPRRKLSREDMVFFSWNFKPGHRDEPSFQNGSETTHSGKTLHLRTFLG